MCTRLIIVLLFLTSCNSYEEPHCFKLKYKMSKEEAQKMLSHEAGEFYLFQDWNDFVRYRKDKCVMEFHKQTGWLIKASYEVFSEISEAGPNAIPKK